MILESVVRYGIQIWYGNLSAQLKAKLMQAIKAALRIMGVINPNYLQGLYEKAVLREARKILSDPTHILNSEFEILPSGRRLRMPSCRLNRYKNSFIPVATKILNKS